jgi:membrane protease subunit (stomatin/prohibitin family)
MVFANGQEGETMDDVISRQAALDELRDAEKHAFNSYYKGLIKAHKIIAGLPPAQPERKKGKWICEYDGKFTGGAYWFSCSKCKRIVPEVRNGGWNFCPNCGADMRGE